MDDTDYWRDRIKGYKEGKAEEKKETALNLLRMGLSNGQISQATGLSSQEIEKLKAEFN